MELPNKNLGTLFDQLGLESDPASIDAFIAKNGRLPEDVRLADAPFWNESQRSLLRDEWIEDAEWAPIVDELNVRMHEH
ncbi:DUF2789 domain-containing protein [Pseudomonas stutzeri]|uniref:DUF2789 domain-containing protein n=1 Tax=Stutzerimonas stutzeri TaxID=316 RepID=A0A2N8S318_STUST|nr:DUF2789 domain-containing protein [Stutzerimonas stutzeri]MCQ4296578.1 DUF2789 domain-containing protein [Stutzerimonas stutzeri]PNF81007.1 DUF2789 domain-containing protein [Stutzerimonas stutzeri]